MGNTGSAQQSVATQLMRVVFLMYCVVAVIVTSVHIIKEYQYTQDTISNELRSYEKIFGPVLSTALWDLERQQINDIVTGLNQVPVIVGIKIEILKNDNLEFTVGRGIIKNAQNQQIKVLDDDSIKTITDHQFTDLFSYQFPITYEFNKEIRVLGFATLYSDSTVVLDRVQLGFMFLIANAIIKGIALWFIFLWVSKKLLLSPLLKLTQAISDVKFNTLSEIKINLGIKNKNELTVIEDYFERMVSELAVAQQKVLKFNSELEKEVRAQTKNLLAAKISAEQSSQARSEFLARMSHEIRTPMNGVLGMLNLMLTDKLSDEQQKKAEIAKSSANSLLSLINDILDFSKIDANKLELENIDFNLRKLLGEAVETLALNAEEKNIELILDTVAINDRLVRGDPSRVKQIIINLLSNSVKFTEHGEVLIKAALSTGKNRTLVFSCSITDTGIGIPEAKISTLFNLFSQVDGSTTRKYGGTGLGLSIVKKLCDLMDGEIKVTSKLNKGTCFEFSVLLHPSTTQTKMTPFMTKKTHHILVVDDNQSNRNMLQQQLQLWGADVTLAVGGKSALKILNDTYLSEIENNFILVLLDMNMPLMSGISLAKTIKSDSRFKSLKLVLMTQMCSQYDHLTLQEYGFCDAFPKPVIFSHLINVLTAYAGVDQSIKLEFLPENNLEDLSLNHDLMLENKGLSSEETLQLQDSSRILVVEDNRVNQLVIKGVLESIGFKIDIAGNGVEALNKMKQSSDTTPFSLLLMDVQMPVMDGYEASSKIRQGYAGKLNQNIPIIALTANAMEGDKARCLESGMNDYLAKPIDKEQLEQKLYFWLTNVAQPFQQKDEADL